MKLAFAAALIAAVQATESLGYGGYGGVGLGKGIGLGKGVGLGYGGKQVAKGGYAKVSYTPVTKVVQPAKAADNASAGYAAQYQTKKTTDWDAWGRDQDLAIDESYGKTSAKSYTAESYDEWDNADDDKWGAQAWGKDRDLSGASSYARDASVGARKGKKLATDRADWEGGAAMSGYDNDEWAKQAYGSDYDSRWGKSYDSVAARSYDNEHYAREVRADDDQWAEDYDTQWAGKADGYGNAASAKKAKGIGHGWGKHNVTTKKAASAGAGQEYWAGDVSDWDAYGRDQDFHEKVSYDTTMAKSYSAESYDEWDNTDADKWGAQAWGKDRDLKGASSYGRKASSNKDTAHKYGYAAGYGAAGQKGYAGQAALGKAYGGKGHGWGKGGLVGGQAYGAQGYAGAAGAYGAQKAYGQGKELSNWQGASAANKASKAAYDNDAFAKQAYGSDSDTRWGKSYDSVSARSYQNEKYARWLQADDDQWAEDYDAFENDDAGAYGKAASYWGPGGKFGGFGGYGKKRSELDAASKAGQTGYWGKTGSDWDAYGRDQDLEVDESYEATWAKSYDAESYDEWDNADADKWGAQAWGKDRDVLGKSSVGVRASESDKDLAKYGYGQAYGAYGAAGQKGYGQAGLIKGKGGFGGYGGYGHGLGGVGVAGAYGAKGAAAYGGVQGGQYSKKKSLKEAGASTAHAAAAVGYDNDEWAKQAYGRDMDTRWGKSYDFVDANSYDDEQYARKVRADDDQWAEDYDRRTSLDHDQIKAAASTEARQPQIKKTAFVPHVQYGQYGSYGGYGGVAHGKGGYAW